MTRAEIAHEVLAIVVDQRVRDVEVTAHSRIVEDLGFDSMSVLELASAVEERFDITVPLNDLPAIRTVDGIVQYVAAARDVS